MNKLAISLSVVVLGCLATIPLYFMKESQDDKLVASSSDVGRYDHHIKVATDSWKGYKILCGDTNKNMLRQKRIRLECIDDSADYQVRMENLKDKKVQFAVLEVGAYVLEGANYDYPASIITAIDTSYQGDALVANKTKIPDLESLRQNPNTKVGLTMKSPSETFGKTISSHYDLSLFKNQNNFVESNGSKDAMMKLLKGEVPTAILWEPYRSIALKDPNMVEIISTKDAQNTIVDVLSVERSFGEKNPDLVKTVLATYFKALKYYKENPTELISEIKTDKDTKGMSDSDINKMVEGIRWVNLSENCSKWFACDVSDWSAKMEIIETIDSTLKIWQEFDDLDSNPFPKKDSYNLVNGEYLADLFANGIIDDSTGDVIVNSLEKKFSAWTDKDWDSAKNFGKLKNNPVKFTKNAELRISSKEAIDEIAQKLKHYPNFRIKIEGHTGTLGDKANKMKISQERAEWVKRYLQLTYNIDENRIYAVGIGATKPLPLKLGQDEYNKAYQSKLSRVEIYLIQETY